MRSGTRLAWPAVAMIVVLLSAVITGGCAKDSGQAGRGPGAAARDPRAYEVDSGDLPLDEGLRRAGLKVPDCLQDDLRYALVDDGLGYHFKVYLRLESSVSCMDKFLEANGMRDTFQATKTGGTAAERPLVYRDAWMDDELIRQMGWDIGSEQRFQEFGMGNEKLYRVDALVQHVPDSSRLQAYVYAFHGG